VKHHVIGKAIEKQKLTAFVNEKWKAKGRTRKWDSNGVVDHTEDRTCQLLYNVETSTLHPKYPK